MITPKKSRTGKTGPMREVDSWDIKKDLNECSDKAAKDTLSNRKELQRIGREFYGRYHGATECSCGSCGTVYRFPTGDYMAEDVEMFWELTRKEKCPCCEKPIHELMPVDADIYFEKRELKIFGVTMLSLPKLTKPLNPPEEEE